MADSLSQAIESDVEILDGTLDGQQNAESSSELPSATAAVAGLSPEVMNTETAVDAQSENTGEPSADSTATAVSDVAAEKSPEAPVMRLLLLPPQPSNDAAGKAAITAKRSKMSSRRCSVNGCGNMQFKYFGDDTKKVNSKAIFHTFPDEETEPTRRGIWKDFCENGPNFRYNTKAYICSDHFPDSCYTSSMCCLKKTAIPSLKPPSKLPTPSTPPAKKPIPRCPTASQKRSWTEAGKRSWIEAGFDSKSPKGNFPTASSSPGIHLPNSSSSIPTVTLARSADNTQCFLIINNNESGTIPGNIGTPSVLPAQPSKLSSELMEKSAANVLVKKPLPRPLSAAPLLNAKKEPPKRVELRRRPRLDSFPAPCQGLVSSSIQGKDPIIQISSPLSSGNLIRQKPTESFLLLPGPSPLLNVMKQPLQRVQLRPIPNLLLESSPAPARDFGSRSVQETESIVQSSSPVQPDTSSSSENLEQQTEPAPVKTLLLPGVNLAPRITPKKLPNGLPSAEEPVKFSRVDLGVNCKSIKLPRDWCCLENSEGVFVAFACFNPVTCENVMTLGFNDCMQPIVYVKGHPYNGKLISRRPLKSLEEVQAMLYQISVFPVCPTLSKPEYHVSQSICEFLSETRSALCHGCNGSKIYPRQRKRPLETVVEKRKRIAKLKEANRSLTEMLKRRDKQIGKQQEKIKELLLRPKKVIAEVPKPKEPSPPKELTLVDQIAVASGKSAYSSTKYNDEMKNFAVDLRRISIKAYRFLRSKGFSLPAEQLLSRWYSKKLISEMADAGSSSSPPADLSGNKDKDDDTDENGKDDDDSDTD